MSASRLACLIALLVLSSGLANAQIAVGKVAAIEGEGQGHVSRDLGQEREITPGEDVMNGDVLRVSGRPVQMEVQITDRESFFLKSGRMSMGVVSATGGVHARLMEGVVMVKGHHEWCNIETKAAQFQCQGTRFEVHAEGDASRVFVYEGSVIATSANPDITGQQIVRAGEWVRVRSNQPVPPPQRWLLTRSDGPGSGASRCIYSDCTIIRNVVIPEPPVYSPRPLLAPPLNPPPGLTPPGGG